VGLSLLAITLASCEGAQLEKAEEIADSEQALCNASEVTISQFPLAGTNGRNWMINNYLDLDPAASATKDYLNKTGSLARTYDGHTGIDIDIPSFREMDGNTAVIRAAAPGVVDQVVQNQPDRNTSCTGSWNVVRVKHANGFFFYYGHIKRNSAMVSVGQTVAAGTRLAIAGSSGCSTQPHVHFEVQNCSGTPIETLLQPGMWSSPPVYDPPSDILDVMLRAGAAPTVAQIKDPAPNPTLITPNSTLGIGLSAAVRGGDVINVTLVPPSGASSSQSFTVSGVARFGHWYPAWSFTIGSTVGTWTIQVRVNNVLKTTRTIGVSTLTPGFAQVARHGVSNAQYQSVFTDVTTAGYRPEWVDGYEVSGATFFNALFSPPDTAWVARHNLTGAQYQTEFNNWVGQGYRLAQVDSYLNGGQVLYAAIFDKRSVPQWTAYHGVSQATHVANFNNLTSQGYRPVNISAVNGGTRTFTALYDKKNVGSFFTLTGMTESEYQAQFDANIAAGRRPAYIDAFMESGVPKISAIWNQVNAGSWVARHGLTSAQYQAEFNTWTAQGLLVRAVTGYESGGSARFAALFTSAAGVP
jgi:murein DD-endopeptidase MepM/ murein hydrolase activator NlpD